MKDKFNNNNDNHVFIVGLMRTGTSIMYRTIQKLPNFQSTQLNFMETKIFMNDISFNTDDLYYPSLFGYFNHNKEIYDEFLRSVKKYTDKLRTKKTINKYALNIKLQMNFFDRYKIFLKNKLVEIGWKRSYKSKIIKEYFTYARKIRQSKRIVEKTPHHCSHLHQILWTFPNSRIIWMIRHPIDIITSSIKRAKTDKKYINYWNTESFINEFKGSYYKYNFYKRFFNQNIIMIKYEDFVNDTVNQLKKICDFIDEPFCEDSLTLKDHEVPKWKSYSPYIFSDIVNKTDRDWKEYLSMEEGEKIETVLKYLMEEFNFDFYTRK